MAGRLRSILRVLLARDRFENGMTEELRFHIETYADDLVRSGVRSKTRAAGHGWRSGAWTT